MESSRRNTKKWLSEVCRSFTCYEGSNEITILEKMELFTTVLEGVCAIFSAPRIADVCAYAKSPTMVKALLKSPTSERCLN